MASMTDLNTIRSEVTLTNKNLARATEKIYKLADTMRKSAYEVAVIIANVEVNQWFLDDGFEDIHAWTAKMFGFKKSASYNLLKIGKEWSRTVLNEAGKPVAYRSILTDADAPIDFTTSQVALLLPEGIAAAKELVEEEVITPEMTCEDIRKKLKELHEPKPKHTDPDTEDDQEDSEPEQAEAEPMKLVTDGNGHEYMIPISVLAQYEILPGDSVEGQQTFKTIVPGYMVKGI